MNDYDHSGVTIAASIDATQTLDHALPGHQVAHHMIRIEVHTNLGRRGRDEKCGFRLQDLACGEETKLLQSLPGPFPLEHPATTDKKLGFDCCLGSTRIGITFYQFLEG